MNFQIFKYIDKCNKIECCCELCDYCFTELLIDWHIKYKNYKKNNDINNYVVQHIALQKLNKFCNLHHEYSKKKDNFVNIFRSPDSSDEDHN